MISFKAAGVVLLVGVCAQVDQEKTPSDEPSRLMI